MTPPKFAELDNAELPTNIKMMKIKARTIVNAETILKTVLSPLFFRKPLIINPITIRPTITKVAISKILAICQEIIPSTFSAVETKSNQSPRDIVLEDELFPKIPDVEALLPTKWKTRDTNVRTAEQTVRSP